MKPPNNRDDTDLVVAAFVIIMAGANFAKKGWRGGIVSGVVAFLVVAYLLWEWNKGDGS